MKHKKLRTDDRNKDSLCMGRRLGVLNTIALQKRLEGVSVGGQSIFLFDEISRQDTLDVVDVILVHVLAD